MNDSPKEERAEKPFWQSRPWIDGVWLVLVFGAVLLIAIRIEAFDYVLHLSDAHEHWELDEIMTTLMVLPIGLGIYAKRRLDETRQELRRRKAAEEEASQMALHDPLTGLANRRKAQIEIS
ncbi:GGDEF domain-containing protein, partial [Hyphomonas sp.]|uniref:GGDEF domain-containing protein n=1 Tax=Hyphomonas sp. TaxID=87 RepID=UPI003242F564